MTSADGDLQHNHSQSFSRHEWDWRKRPLALHQASVITPRAYSVFVVYHAIAPIRSHPVRWSLGLRRQEGRSQRAPPGSFQVALLHPTEYGVDDHVARGGNFALETHSLHGACLYVRPRRHSEAVRRAHRQCDALLTWRTAVRGPGSEQRGAADAHSFQYPSLNPSP